MGLEHEAGLFCSALSATGVGLLLGLLRWALHHAKKLLALLVSNDTHNCSVKTQFPGATQCSAYLYTCFICYSMYSIAFSQHTLKPTQTGLSAFLPSVNMVAASFGAVGTNFLTASDRIGVSCGNKDPTAP